jgi:HK97 family phage major capsid protein
MTKSLRDLKQDFAEKQTAWETKMNAKAPIEEIREAFESMKETRALLEMQEQAEKMVVLEKREDVKPQIEQRELTNEEVEVAYKDVFLKAVRNKDLNKNDMNIFERMKEIRDVPTATPYLSSASDADGGLIVPKDVQTRINEYKRQYAFELQSLVDVERVTAPTGLRVFEKLAESVAFVNIDEWDTIAEVATPQFEKKEYSLAQYAGILPIPRNLLQDTDAALLDTIAKFIARKTIVTRNAQILAKINESYATKKALAGIDDFKDVLNVELDAVFANNAKIITNQDGFNVLDKLKDENGNYLLQPDVKSPTGKALLGKAVVLVPNRELPSKTGKAPVYIGDMKEAIKFFDRGVYEITSTEIGGNAFTRNSMDIRVIDRFGVEAWDTAAVIAGELTVPTGV